MEESDEEVLSGSGEDRKPVGKPSHSTRITTSVRPRGVNRAVCALSLSGEGMKVGESCADQVRPGGRWFRLYRPSHASVLTTDGEANVKEVAQPPRLRPSAVRNSPAGTVTKQCVRCPETDTENICTHHSVFTSGVLRSFYSYLYFHVVVFIFVFLVIGDK